MKSIISEIISERQKQDEKWGVQNHPCLNQTLLTREGGCTPNRMCQNYEIPNEDRARLLCEVNFARGKGTYAHIALEEFAEAVSEFDPVKRRKELIQLAAVTVAWIEKIDRDLGDNKPETEDYEHYY